MESYCTRWLVIPDWSLVQTLHRLSFSTIYTFLGCAAVGNFIEYMWLTNPVKKKSRK